MAKLGFKDILMKYLKKEEDKIKEDAPANATGTAVAGTGDDSSTVVVKKKKDQQKKLMKRMGITEAINRAIPDLEYPKDEIRERVNQLKQLALGEAAPDPTTYGPDKVAKAMAIAVKSDGQYSKAVRDIEKIAKNLSNVSTIARALKTANEDLTEFKKMVVTIADPMKRKKAMDDLESLGREQNVDTGFKIQRLGSRSFKVDGMGADLNKYATDMKNFYGATVKAEDLDAQPQDKDVKKVKGTQPKKYYKKLDKDTKKKRAAFFKKKAGTYKKSDDDDDYKAAPGDKKAKTKPSIHTKKFKQMYGEGLLDLEEKIKGLENKAKKTGMPYGILKKVYDRGMAAWKGGHRPGATQQQWAFARVNSFVTKSSGTWGGADKDLAKKVRGSK